MCAVPLRLLSAALLFVAAVPARGAALKVRLDPPDEADVLAGRVLLVARVEGGTAVEVRFLVDGALLAVDRDPPFRAVWLGADTLRDHLLRVTAIAADGFRAHDLVSIPVLGPVSRTTVSAFPPDFILLDVTFLDYAAHPLVDVSPEEVRLTERGERKRVELFVPDDRPLALLLLLDASESTAPIWPVLERSTRLFAATLREGDRAGVEAFNERIHLVAPVGSPIGRIANGISRFNGWGGGTQLWDALARAALYTLGREESRRRAVVVLTDAVDSASTLASAEARDYLSRAGVEVHAVLWAPEDGVGWAGMRTRLLHTSIQADLVRITESTGGAEYQGNEEPLPEIFLRIGERLRAQYLLGYSSDAPPGPLREVKVKLARKGKFQVHVREGHHGGEPLAVFLADEMDSGVLGRQLAALNAAFLSREPALLHAVVRLLAAGPEAGGVASVARANLLRLGVEAVPYLQAAAESGAGDLPIHASRVLADQVGTLYREGRTDDLLEALDLLGGADPETALRTLDRLLESGPSPTSARLLQEMRDALERAE